MRVFHGHVLLKYCQISPQTEFMINNRGDSWKTNINLRIGSIYIT